MAIDAGVDRDPTHDLPRFVTRPDSQLRGFITFPDSQRALTHQVPGSECLSDRAITIR
jgi:hypothetical protein